MPNLSILAAIAVVLVGPAALADAPDVDEIIVLSPTRTPTPIDQVASSITVITAADIALKQQRTLPDVLRDVPGLNLIQTGGTGGTTSLFIRGANSNHTKVIIDGIDASDPSTPTGTFEFANLLTGAVQQVEVLRGPQSGLYGSDAIGGVVAVTTRSGSGPPRLDASLEGGSFATFNQAAELSGGGRRLSYAFDLEHLRSAAIPVTPLDLLPPGQARNDDAYDNLTAATKLGLKLSDRFDVGLVARYVHSDLRFTSDFDFGAGPDPVQSQTLSNQLFVRGTAHLAWLDGRLDQILGLGWTDYRSKELIPNNPAAPEDGDRLKADWQGSLRLAPGEALTAGAEGERDAIHGSPISASVTNAAGFLELQSSLGGRLFDAASVRFDHNGQFGGKATWRIAPALLIPESGTKLKASVGSGFKAPTLNELYVSYPAFGFFANPALKPESSLGYDLGVEQTLAHGRVRLGATWFHNDIRNLITANADFTTSINIGRATTYGVESFVQWRPSDRFSLRGDYTYVRAWDDIADQELLRRPRHKASLDGEWRPAPRLALNGTLLYVGPWIDGNRDFTIARLNAPAYVTVNLAATWQANRRWALFGRISNLLDRRYQDPIGFLAPGRGAFVGVRATL
jgi:vitamin B12 transporter